MKRAEYAYSNNFKKNYFEFTNLSKILFICMVGLLTILLLIVEIV
jgi:hypothetical protein